MRSEGSFEGLSALVADRGAALLATATLLAGSRAAGEDLLQAALERVMRHWHRVSDDPEIYLRRTIYHLAVDQWRARRRQPEVLGRTGTQLETDALHAGQSDGTDAVHLRMALIQGLSQLPPRQRAVLVLRYWEQLSESEAADVLGCSVGTVKSSASRGLARLREVAAVWAADDSKTLVNGVWS
ncbi:MAG TPA: SigE family RNA polymerase sigma factor [Streptosporangiaceae bacterium]|nr:SigE family RNA polymerase sigma factor [Streptosporangiaceae bacterium]